MRNKLINIFGVITNLLLFLTSIILMLYLIKINVLKNSLIIIIAVVEFLIFLLFTLNINNLKRSKTKRVFSMIGAAIFSIIYIFLSQYVNNTVTFIENTTKVKKEYQTYVILSKNDSSYSKLSDLKNKNIGFITSNTYIARTKNTLDKKLLYKAKDYDDTASAIGALNDKKANGIVLESNYLDILKENNEEIYNSLKEVYRFKVVVPKKVVTSNLNVKDPFIVYISGSDSRGSLNEVARSDVNIVAVVNPIKKKVLLVSIPRDYYVQLHGTTGTKDKLTHAGIYGVDMSKNTIADLLDTDINYFVKVGFGTVIKSVDLVGGIDIYSEKAFTPRANSNCKIVEGTQHLNGECALAFSRERYTYISGDRHRGENQQQVITKMIEKFTTIDTLTKYNSILSALNGSFQTNISYNDITSIIKEEATSFSKWDVESISLDGSGASLPTYSMGSQKLYVMIPFENTINNAKEKIKEYLSRE